MMPRPARPLLLLLLLTSARLTADDLEPTNRFYAEEAARLAALPYAPGFQPPTAFARNLNYDALRNIRIQRQHCLFNESAGNLRVEPRLAGSFNSKGIQLNLLQDGLSHPVPFKASFFKFPQDITTPGENDLPGYGGFRVLGPTNTGGPVYEQFTFGGASYFRGHPDTLNYGLSARGLILRKSGKEEFPLFERFAFEEPAPQSSQLVWHALLNSPSTTGAFRFHSTPGSPAIMEVHADIFLRAGLRWDDVGIGLAGFSSMFWFSPASARRTADFRERVHDSDGLAVATTSGEHFWRVLTNPAKLRHSSFPIQGLSGFGLIQRERSFAAYEDEVARYERRTSAWVIPLKGMTSGRIKLLEIPTANEYNDNIVAFFEPETPPAPGEPLRIAYRLMWCDDVPADTGSPPARIVQTRVGQLPDKSGITLLTVDFASASIDPLPIPEIQMPSGLKKQFAYLKPLPDGKTTRLHLGVLPEDSGTDANQNGNTGEIRVRLVREGKPVSETWIYPWSGVPRPAP
ncbi:glucan biosynthesis protein [Verrucomicrobium sp. BvORR106]|uniref:glucan biosynthesis protein n=1 Tax=Verrucomicrobium sp. BvORR106 TaxID=1403819 RepID=UPI00068CE97E|nr:glucan biosynthesis protein [Verrucomicrobium sp. BvORR106]